jgi:hypothetical protein
VKAESLGSSPLCAWKNLFGLGVPGVMSAFRWFLLALLVVGAMFTASWCASATSWERCLAWTAERRASLLRDAVEGPVLFREPIAGSSREAYATVVATAATVPDGVRERLRALAEATDEAFAPEESDVVMLRTLAPVIDGLRGAVRRAGVPADTQERYAVPPEVFDILLATDAVLVDARCAARDGRTGDAVAGLVDVLACGVDFANGPSLLVQVVGAMIVNRGCDAFGDGLLVVCERELLVRLDAALAAADAALPPWSPVLADEVVMLVEHLQAHAEIAPMDLGLRTPLQAWRQGFSVRRFAEARAVQLMEFAERVERDARGNDAWPRRSAFLAALAEEDRRGTLAVWRPSTASLVAHEEARREALVRLRMLRLALATHLGESLPVLADALGDGPLRAETTDLGVRFTSASSRVQRVARMRR